MKLLFSLSLLLSLPVIAQEEKNIPPEKEEVTAESRQKQEEQEQSETSVENPFKIGPYENGKYLFKNPDRKPEEEEAAEI